MHRFGGLAVDANNGTQDLGYAFAGRETDSLHRNVIAKWMEAGVPEWPKRCESAAQSSYASQSYSPDRRPSEDILSGWPILRRSCKDMSHQVVPLATSVAIDSARLRLVMEKKMVGGGCGT